jgi:hypothetical protein
MCVCANGFRNFVWLANIIFTSSVIRRFFINWFSSLSPLSLSSKDSLPRVEYFIENKKFNQYMYFRVCAESFQGFWIAFCYARYLHLNFLFASIYEITYWPKSLAIVFIMIFSITRSFWLTGCIFVVKIAALWF